MISVEWNFAQLLHYLTNDVNLFEEILFIWLLIIGVLSICCCRDLDPELSEAVSSLIWFEKKQIRSDELKGVAKQLVLKYGKVLDGDRHHH